MCESKILQSVEETFLLTPQVEEIFPVGREPSSKKENISQGLNFFSLQQSCFLSDTL